MKIPDRQQYSGCLIGQCLGDALGFPVEGSPHAPCLSYVDTVVRTGGKNRRGRHPFPFGQYSDDSQLARELLISYSKCQGFDPGDYAGRIAESFSKGRIVGGGRATWEAAIRLSQGIPWDEAGTPSPSAGNGSAMRAGPVGLMFFDDPEALIRAAQDQGRITHKDPRCSAGAVAIAGAVALALSARPIQSRPFLSQLSGWSARLDSSVSQGIRALIDWVELDPADTIQKIARAGYAPGYTPDWQGVTPFVTGSVLWSLYAFLHTPGSYLQTIATAIEAGGDVDTTAAMAGAISGAYLGITAIPADLAALLTDRGTWEYSQLVDLAHTCHAVKTRQLTS